MRMLPGAAEPPWVSRRGRGQHPHSHGWHESACSPCWGVWEVKDAGQAGELVHWESDPPRWFCPMLGGKMFL